MAEVADFISNVSVWQIAGAGKGIPPKGMPGAKRHALGPRRRCVGLSSILDGVLTRESR